MTILQDLCALYKLKENDLPQYGWSSEKVIGELRIDSDGCLRGFASYADADSKVRYRLMNVPEHETRSSGSKPYFLCDKAAYFLGRDEKRGQEHFEKSIALHHRVLDGVDDVAAKATLAFLETQKGVDVLTDEQLALLDGGGFLVFRCISSNIPEGVLAHEQEAVKNAWNRYYERQLEGDVIQCCVTGEKKISARLFPQQTGIPGAQSSGAALVSYNDECYCSYGCTTKDKSRNASLSARTAFESGAALSWLASDKSHRVSIGDTQVLLWTDGDRAEEDEFLRLPFALDDIEKGEDDALRERLRVALENIRKGHPIAGVNAETGYHLLGLAPNAARLAVRFYETGTLGQLEASLRMYLADLSMVGFQGENSPVKSLGFYLRQIAPLGKADNIPNTLIASTLSAILKGTRFPRELLMGAIGRMRADKGIISGGASKTYDVTEYRVSLIKACLQREARLKGDTKLERSLTVSLNKENTNIGYLLGRLFAALEHAQKDALGSVGATIRDRYIGAASATPAKVFPQLLRNAQNHISKIEKSDNPGRGIATERRIQEIVDSIESVQGFSATLTYDDQGQFFIGYYQQMRAIYTPKDKDLD